MSAINEVFKKFDVTKEQARIYLHLIKKKSAKARELAQSLKIDRVQLYRDLKNLQKRGMIESTFEYPASFVAVPFEKVLDLQIKAKRDEAKKLEASKNELMSQIDTINPEINDVNIEKFMVIEGSKYINSKIVQMVQETEEELEVVTSGYGVIQAYQSGLLDLGFEHPLKKKVKFRFLTTLSTISEHLDVTRELLKKAENSSLIFESRISDFGSGYFPRFIIRDKTEMLIYLKMEELDPHAVLEDTGMWSNNQVLVHAFLAFFEKMWDDSRPIKDLLIEK